MKNWREITSLSAAIALFGALSYNINKQEKSDAFKTLLQERAVQEEIFQRNPSEDNKLECRIANSAYNDFLKKEEITSPSTYARGQNLLFLEYGKKSCVRGSGKRHVVRKIVGEEDVEGFKAYLIEDAKGEIDSIASLGESEAASIFQDINGRQAMYIATGLIKKQSNDFSNNWGNIILNNARLKNNDPHWSPSLQALYLEYGDFIKSASKETTENEKFKEILGAEYQRRSLERIKIHELMHIVDKLQGNKDIQSNEKYSLDQLEERAYLKDISKTGSLFHLENGLEGQSQSGIKRKILRDLYSLKSAKYPREFYSRVSKKDVLDGAKIIFDRKYKK